MGLPELQTCCFIFDLKTGNIIMGCLNAVLSFSIFVKMLVEALTLESFEDLAKKTNDPEIEATITGLYAMSIIVAIMFLAKFIFDVIFVYGVNAERPGIIKAYFIMWVVFFLLSMFTFFLNVTRYSAGTISMIVFFIVINVYAILLSHSFYKLLNTREEV